MASGLETRSGEFHKTEVVRRLTQLASETPHFRHSSPCP